MTRVYDFCYEQWWQLYESINGIVAILFQNRLFLVMEFVSGGELMSLICKERGFGEKRSW